MVRALSFNLRSSFIHPSFKRRRSVVLRSEELRVGWPTVARGDVEAPPAIREWAVKLVAKPKFVVSSTRKDFPWTNSHHLAGDLRMGVQKLKDATPAGVHARTNSTRPCCKSGYGWRKKVKPEAFVRPCTVRLYFERLYFSAEFLPPVRQFILCYLNAAV